MFYSSNDNNGLLEKIKLPFETSEIFHKAYMTVRRAIATNYGLLYSFPTYNFLLCFGTVFTDAKHHSNITVCLLQKI